MYDAGQLNRKVELQSFAQVIDPNTGYQVDEWQTFATVMAKVEPLVGREYFEAKATQAENTHKFTMRYRADLEPQHRLLFDGKQWNIQSVINVRSANRELLIMAKTLD